MESLESLMAKYKMGDYQAFNSLYERVSPILYGYLRKQISDQNAVDDIFQAIFTKLHSAKNQYNSSYPLMPWLFTICRTSIADYMRQESKAREIKKSTFNDSLALELTEPATEKSPISQGIISQFERSLSTDQFQAVQMRYVRELSFAQIASELNTSEANARKLVSRAINKIKKRLAKS